MTKNKHKMVNIKEKTKKIKNTKYVYCTQYCIDYSLTTALLSTYDTDMKQEFYLKPFNNEDFTTYNMYNTAINEAATLDQLKLLNIKVLVPRTSNNYGASIYQRMDFINSIFACFQIIRSIYLERFPKGSFKDLDGMTSLLDALLLKTEDKDMVFSIPFLVNFYILYNEILKMNMFKNKHINTYKQIILPSDSQLLKLEYPQTPTSLDFQVYASICILKYVYSIIFIRANNLTDFVDFYSSYPIKRITIYFKLHNAYYINDMFIKRLYMYSDENFKWTKDHMEVLEQYDLLKYVRNGLCMGEEKNYHIALEKTVYPIVQDYVEENTHGSVNYNNIGTNTEQSALNVKPEHVKITKPYRGLFNNSLWIAALCGDSLSRKIDFSAYILKCSYFDEGLNLDPAIKYIQNVVEPLKSPDFVKIFLRDLTKTFLNTLF